MAGCNENHSIHQDTDLTNMWSFGIGDWRKDEKRPSKEIVGTMC